MKISAFSALVSLAWLVSALAAGPPGAEDVAGGEDSRAFAKVEDVPGLPRVLLIGDSISIGYTPTVQKLLARKANVHRIPTDGGPTTRGLAELTTWLGDSRWDVIHFNWGLHDLKFVGQDGKTLVEASAPGAHRQVAMADYERNLRELVERLRSTGANLIWCHTTPVPEGAVGRLEKDVMAYNALAERVMKHAGLPINDLHTYATPRLASIQQPGDVHFTAAGSQVLAEKVAEVIEESLPKR